MRRLHIGGEKKHISPEWEIFNVVDEDWVDHKGDAIDLSRFEDETFDAVYASHVLEHFDFNSKQGGSLHHAMTEWKRVLKTGGMLMISVPSLDRMCELFLDKTLPFEDRLQIMRMIYGGHTNKYNYHYVGFDKDLLLSVFKNAGYKKVWEVEKFGIFKDSSQGNWQASEKVFSGLSINFAARKE